MADDTYIGADHARAAARRARRPGRRCARNGARRCALGGRRIDRPGNWFEPTVLTGVSHAMALMRDESFGPIIGIQKVAGDAEALALMNDTRYGLTAGDVHARRGAGRARCWPASMPAASTGTAATASARACPGRAMATRASASRSRPTASRPSRGRAPGTCARLERAAPMPGLRSFDLDGTLLSGDTDELWCEFLIDRGPCSIAPSSRRATPTSPSATRAARSRRPSSAPSTPRRWPAQRRSPGRRCASGSSTREIAPRLGAGALARWSSAIATAGDRLVLTTATNRFLTEPIAALPRHRRR